MQNTTRFEEYVPLSSDEIRFGVDDSSFSNAIRLAGNKTKFSDFSWGFATFWVLSIRAVNIILKNCYVPKRLFNRRFCFEIVQLSEFSKKVRNFLVSILVNNNLSRVSIPHGYRKCKEFESFSLRFSNSWYIFFCIDISWNHCSMKDRTISEFSTFTTQTYAIFWPWILVNTDLSMLNPPRGLVLAGKSFVFRFWVKNIQF